MTIKSQVAKVRKLLKDPDHVDQALSLVRSLESEELVDALVAGVSLDHSGRFVPNPSLKGMRNPSRVIRGLLSAAPGGLVARELVAKVRTLSIPKDADTTQYALFWRLREVTIHGKAADVDWSSFSSIEALTLYDHDVASIAFDQLPHLRSLHLYASVPSLDGLADLPLESLQINDFRGESLDGLPAGLKSLHIGGMRLKRWGQLPASLEHLRVGSDEALLLDVHKAAPGLRSLTVKYDPQRIPGQRFWHEDWPRSLEQALDQLDNPNDSPRRVAFEFAIRAGALDAVRAAVPSRERTEALAILAPEEAPQDPLTLGGLARIGHPKAQALAQDADPDRRLLGVIAQGSGDANDRWRRVRRHAVRLGPKPGADQELKALAACMAAPRRPAPPPHTAPDGGPKHAHRKSSIPDWNQPAIQAAQHLTVGDYHHYSVLASSHRLPALPALRELHVTSRLLADLTPFQALDGLQVLHARANRKLKSVEGAQALRSLRVLNVSQTNVKDLEPLEKLPLSLLDLYGTKVKKLDPIADLPLRSLRLGKTRALDLSPLAGAGLVELSLSESERLKNLDVVGTLDSLERLYLVEFELDLEMLLALPRLKYVNLRRSPSLADEALVVALRGMLVSRGGDVYTSYTMP